MYNNNKSENIKIETIYSPGAAFLELSYFKTYLVLKLVPWLYKDNTGRDQYCKNTYLSTTLSPEGTAYFFGVAMAILNENVIENQLPAVFHCKRDTTLTLEYKPDENNEMAAYLVINKNKETITFKFKTKQIQMWVDGQKVTKVFQADLEEFAWLLHGYIQKCSAEHLLKKSPSMQPITI